MTEHIQPFSHANTLSFLISRNNDPISNFYESNYDGNSFGLQKGLERPSTFLIYRNVKWKEIDSQPKVLLMKNVTAFWIHLILITLERFLSWVMQHFDRNGSVENLLRKLVWKTNFLFLFCFCKETSWECSCLRRCYKGLTVSC